MGQSDSRERQYEGRVRLEQRLAELRQEMHGANRHGGRAPRRSARTLRHVCAHVRRSDWTRKEVNAALALIRKTFMGHQVGPVSWARTLAIKESAIGQAEN